MRYEDRSAAGTGGIGLACTWWNAALVVTLLWSLASPGGGTAQTVTPEPHAADNCLGTAVLQPSPAAGPPPRLPQAAYQQIAWLAMHFIVNQGQTDPQAKFYALPPGGTVFVTQRGELVYALTQREAKPLRTRDGRVVPKRAVQRVGLTEELLGGTIAAVTGHGAAPTQVSYFRSNDPARWQQGIQSYERVSLGEVYPGIEVQLKTTGRTVEKLFYVQPGAAPEWIRVRLRGGQGLQVNGHGELEVVTPLGVVRGSRPVAYQEVGGQKAQVAVRYVVEGETYGFEVGAYDRSQPLVIDPILAATFLGGSDIAQAFALALDSTGHVYVAGITDSADFPGIGPGAADSTFDNREVFVAKLDAELSTILAATFLGGSGEEAVHTLALDSTGHVYVAGATGSADFPGIGPGAADPTFADGEGFVAKLDTDLSTILAATFLGGSGNERAFALALDGTGNVYVTGFTQSADFPGIGPDAADPTLAGLADAFIAKLDPNLSAGACTQQLVNARVTFVVVDTAFNPTPVAGGPAGTFTITAVLTNISSEDIQEPLQAIVLELTNGNQLLSATEGDGGPGSTQAIVSGADATLTPGEEVPVQFVIGLAVRERFEFFVDVEGCVAPSSTRVDQSARAPSPR